MPIKKYRDVSEMEDPVHAAGSASLYEVIRHVWGLADRLCPLRFPEGVFKHRTIEEAQELRDRWEDDNFVAHQERKRTAERARLAALDGDALASADHEHGPVDEVLVRAAEEEQRAAARRRRR